MLFIIWCSKGLFCFFSELTFLAEWWSGLDIKLYGTKEDFDKLGKESAICLCNHRSDVDWLIGYTVADRAGVLAVCELNWRLASSDQAPVVQRADNFIEWISYCLADKMHYNQSFWQVFTQSHTQIRQRLLLYMQITGL